ncbi:MAG: alanine racemase [Melioribacteraceae bacterium]|jgi:D-serine deaminase-like pyridoxal phosphate-dependent protein|nr:alanine racemase [Melioribacteraceae bacterium]
MKNIFDDIKTPTLFLDKEKCVANISRMAEKAKKQNLIFRPHFKTHQSLEIGKWFREFGVNKITVSSLQMGEYFADDGWKDITVAFPINIREIERINLLAAKIKLNILVESVEAIIFLNSKLTCPVNYFIKIDSGYHRTGVDPQDTKLISDIIEASDKNPKLKFAGFLTHAGHSYKCRGIEEIENVHSSSKDVMIKLKQDFASLNPVISIGDTPSCSVTNDFAGIDEVRPGNFVFYDYTQYLIGSCSLDEIVTAMACPIVAKHSSRNEIVIYGGSHHFSKDSAIVSNGQTSYGLVVNLNDNGWTFFEEECHVISLSQEHGIIRATDKIFNKYSIGGIIGIIPIHSCLAAIAMGRYLAFEKNGISYWVQHI